MEIALSNGAALYTGLMAQSQTKTEEGSVTWYGTNSLLLNLAGQSVLIDPYFSRLPLKSLHSLLFDIIAPNDAAIKSALETAGIEKTNTILITHSHIDHALDAELVAKLTDTELVCAPPLINRQLSRSQNSFQLINPADTHSFKTGKLNLSVFRGKHMPFPFAISSLEQLLYRVLPKNTAPRHAWQYTADALYSYLIDDGKVSFFVMGSAGLPNLQSKRLQVDTLILSIGGLDLLPRSYCKNLLRFLLENLQPGMILLSHWDDFTRPLSEPVTWLTNANRSADYIIYTCRRAGISAFLLPPGKPVSL